MKSSLTKTRHKKILEKRLGELHFMQMNATVKSPISISPPSGPLQWLFQGPPAEWKFLAATGNWGVE